MAGAYANGLARSELAVPQARRPELSVHFHDAFGYVVFYAAIVSFALAVIGRFPRKRVLEITGLPLLIAAQIGLAAGGESIPAIGVLHPLVAFLILGFAGRLAFEAGLRPRRRG